MLSYLLSSKGLIVDVQRPVLVPIWGQYEGDCVVRLLPDGRRVRLDEPYAFIPPDGRRIEMPRGFESDGLSIPRIAWLFQSPYTGKGREAAWPHDWLCNEARNGPVDYTAAYAHHVLYQASRAAGGGRRWSGFKEKAVLWFGPKQGQRKRLPFGDRPPYYHFKG